MAKEENIITPEEFEGLEKTEKEKKKKKLRFFGRKEKKKKEESKLESKGKEKEPIMDLTLKLERLLGRVEILENNRSEVTERINGLSERIGELRSSAVELDKNYSELARDFGSLSEVAKELKPEKILKNLEKKEIEIEKNNAKIESLEDKLSIISNKSKDISAAMEQMKGLKDVVSVAGELNKKIDIVNDLKTKTEKNAGKVETLFYELKENLNKLQENLDKVEANEDSIKEMLRTVDKLSLKLTETAPKEDLEESRKELEEKLSELKFDTETKFTELVEAIKGINTKAGGGATKDLNEDFKKFKENFNNELLELSKICEKLNQEQETIKRDQGDKPTIPNNLEDIINTKLSEKLKSVNSELGMEIDKKVEGLTNIQDQKMNNKFSELSNKLKTSGNLEDIINTKLSEKLKSVNSEINMQTDKKIESLLEASEEQQEKKVGADFRLFKNEIKELINLKSNNISKKQKEELEEQLKLEKESLNKRFSDMETKLLGLSKIIDDRIEGKLLMEKNKIRESIASKRELSDQAEEISKSVISHREEPKKIDPLTELVNYIQVLINSGSYREAREQFIKLISEYEKQKESNPKILMKITDFHNRLGY